MTEPIKNPTDPVVKDTILARLEVLSRDLHFSSGDQSASISRDEMIKHVTDEDAIGLNYIETEMEFIRALRAGLVQQIVSSNSISQ